MRWGAFEERIEQRGDCHIWTGPRVGGSYGIHRGTRAHRVAFERAHGPIPAGMLVLHRCDVPLCVNPAHLFLGTQRDNMRDMVAKGRHAHAGPTPAGRERMSALFAGRSLSAETREKMRRSQRARRQREKEQE